MSRLWCNLVISSNHFMLTCMNISVEVKHTQKNYIPRFHTIMKSALPQIKIKIPIKAYRRALLHGI